MSDTTTKTPISQELIQGIKDLCTEHREVFLVSLCTTDGFDIKTFTAKSLTIESDKVAAMASTIGALSVSSSKQIFEAGFQITTIETEQGNLLFVATEYLEMPCVLTIAVRSKMSLATARFGTNRLAKLISSIK